MATRAITTVKDNNGKTLMVLYRQSDGYQDCHGRQLKEFLENKVMVNGISYGDDRDIANGMGCLAAQMVYHFKDRVGLFYIYPEGYADEWVDYYYTVYPTNSSDDSSLSIKVESFSDVIFKGLISDYKAQDSDED